MRMLSQYAVRDYVLQMLVNFLYRYDPDAQMILAKS